MLTHVYCHVHEQWTSEILHCLFYAANYFKKVETLGMKTLLPHLNPTCTSFRSEKYLRRNQQTKIDSKEISPQEINDARTHL